MNNTLAWNGSAFSLTDYLGSSVSIGGSGTSGIQEWLNLCNTNGMPGQAATPSSHPFVLSTPVTVPNASLLHAEIVGSIVTQGIGFYSAFVFDSFAASYFRHRGIIHYNGTGHPVQLNPQTAGPGGIAIDYSEIHFGLIDASGSSGLAHCVHIDPTHGAINNNKISFRQINAAAKAQFNVWVISPNNQIAVNSCFGQNDIDVGLAVGATVAAIQEGNAHYVPSQMALGTNKWEIGAITTMVPMQVAMVLCGQCDIVRIGSISVNGAGNNISTGIYFGTGTLGNHVTVRQNEGLTPVLNGGAATNVVI
jgi:hypothetical protein